MKSRWLPIVLALTAAALAAPAGAHHSFSAIYRADQKVEIKGEVVQLLFRNPHSILHVLAPDESGEMTRWAVEWQGATQLGAGGITGQTLRPGDPVIVTGNPGRDPAEHRIRMLSIKRTTDGLRLGHGAGPGRRLMRAAMSRIRPRARALALALTLTCFGGVALAQPGPPRAGRPRRRNRRASRRRSISRVTGWRWSRKTGPGA